VIELVVEREKKHQGKHVVGPGSSHACPERCDIDDKPRKINCTPGDKFMQQETNLKRHHHNHNPESNAHIEKNEIVVSDIFKVGPERNIRLNICTVQIVCLGRQAVINIQQIIKSIGIQKRGCQGKTTGNAQMDKLGDGQGEGFPGKENDIQKLSEKEAG